MESLIENTPVVNILHPQTVTSVATGDYISVKNYQKVTFTINLGTVTVGSKINVKEAKNVSGSSAANLSFDYYYEMGATPSDTYTKTSADSSGACCTVGNSDDNSLIHIEIDPATMTASFDCLTLYVASSTANMVIAATATMQKSRYGQAAPPTAITN